MSVTAPVDLSVGRIRRTLRSKRELARLNHILLPAKKTDRDRFRKSIAGRLLSPMFGAYGSLSREGRAMFLVTLLVGFAGLDVLQTQVHLLFSMLAGIIVASLAARPFFRAHGLTVRVDAPPRVSVGERQRFVVTMANRGPRTLTTLRVGAPFLPWDGVWIKGPDPIGVLKPGASTTASAEARFIARGEHHLDSFDVAMLVPFGFAVGPRRQSEGAKFLVVPKIANVTSLALEHAPPTARDARVLTQVQGEAEFAAVRPYRPGDALKHLHARTWARTGIPHVRSYVAERTERVMLALALDGDEASENAKEAALGLAAGIAAAMVKGGGGLAALVLDIETFRVEPRTGHAALDAVLDRLGVHQLSDAEKPIAETLKETAPSASSVVLVTADESPRRRAIVDGLALRGVPLRWVRVLEKGAADRGADDRVTRVPLEAIESQEEIAL